MAGPDGVRGEFFKGLYTLQRVFNVEKGLWVELHVYDTGRGSVLGDLTMLLNHAFKSGDVPGSWCSAFLSAVFKKGDPTVLDNYRGIAVGSVLGKVLSLVLHARLSSWSETVGCRASGQAGFRDGYRTSDHVFVLKHLVDKCRSTRGSRLYTCFVDFRKAYDLVHRDLLLQCLRDLGVTGKTLGVLVSMYWQAPMTVKSGATLGATFNSTRGVKQGDPLSPLLFGLFIDRLEAWLCERLPDCGVQLGERWLRLLLYADDLMLIGLTAQQLQSLLDCLQEFCAQYSLEVNVSKCAVVVFGRDAPRPGLHVPQGGWRYSGQQLPLVEEFRYLGIVFHQSKGVNASVSALSQAGRRAMWGMLSRCRDKGIHSLSVRVQLFDALVAPVLGYCAEVWGPTLLHSCRSPEACLVNELQAVQTLFMRQLGGGLRKSTPKQLMLREFGCQPLVRGWLHSMLGLWNRVAGVPEAEATLLREAMIESISLGLPSGWFLGFTSLLRLIGAVTDSTELLCPDGSPQQLSQQHVLTQFDEWFYQCWRDLPHDPRLAPSDKVTCCKYQHWFASEGGNIELPGPLLDRGRWTDCPDYVANTAGLGRERMRALSCFRLAAHDLEVETLKWQGVPRDRRFCGLCGVGIGDELHMLAECTCYAAVRERHQHIFESLGGWRQVVDRQVSAQQFREFMSQNQFEVANFLHECAQRRWRDPPDELVFAECDPVEVEEDGVVGPAGSESSESFFDAHSDEFYDVYSDEYLDCESPMSRAGSLRGVRAMS